MSATIILTTSDASLETAWRAQMLPREPATFSRPGDFQRELARPGARIWIADVNDPRTQTPAGANTLLILVGQPHSVPFEQARQNRAARVFLSYDESRTRLADTINLLEEVAEKNFQLQTALERSRRLESSPPFPREAPAAPDFADALESVESALEHLGDRARLLDEFRRACRYQLKSSRVAFFLRDEDNFATDRENYACDAAHALPRWLEEHPAVIDFAIWLGTADPAIDAPIQQALQTWGTRLLVPLHTHGQLQGWISLGPRADGSVYRDADKSRAVMIGRLLERSLERCQQLEELEITHRDAELRARYLPGARLLTRAMLAGTDLPVEVRAVAGEALATRQTVTQPARPPHRYRVQAGPAPEIDGVWAVWEEAAPEIERIRAELERHRRELFKNLSLTLSHELSNPLVSLVTFSQLLARPPSAEPFPTGAPALARNVALQSEVEKLQRLAEHAALLGAIAEPLAESTDLNLLLGDLARSRDITCRATEESISLRLDPRLMRFAFGAIFDAVTANRLEEGAKNLILSVRSTGIGDQCLAVVLLEGKRLELDGVLPIPAPGAAPNQGRLSVFLAREILRMHGGVLQAGPGMKGTDIQISVGHLR